MNKIRWILVLVGFAMLAMVESRSTFILTDKPECSLKRQQSIDRMVSKLLIFGKYGQKYPTNSKELTKLCADITANTNQLNKFVVECLKDQAQHMAKIMIYSIKRTLKTYCSKKTKKQTKLLESGSCINTRVQKIDCIDKFSNSSKELVPYKIENEKIKFICCYHVDMMRCFEKQMEDLSCLDDDARRYNMELIKSIVVDLANFACGEYTEDSDRCDNLKLPKDKYNPKEKFTSRVRSMFFVLLHVAESIDNFAIDT
ncbi:hypothetical protein QR98_0101000 [Sarcoptes scabiei]|uniref:Uncharacterized protein n=1 Tax=Sarcoptes scabiei TaxID=52283 RepID=A0A132AKH9_SARSC|nr:hypothetical protein QR98_0101000 [Sarcoptes scabiei]